MIKVIETAKLDSLWKLPKTFRNYFTKHLLAKRLQNASDFLEDFLFNLSISLLIHKKQQTFFTQNIMSNPKLPQTTVLRKRRAELLPTTSVVYRKVTLAFFTIF